MALTGSVLLFASGETVPALTALTLAAITGFSFTQWPGIKERVLMESGTSTYLSDI